MPLNYMNAKKRGLVKLAGGGPVDSGGAVEHLASIQDELASEKIKTKRKRNTTLFLIRILR